MFTFENVPVLLLYQFSAHDVEKLTPWVEATVMGGTVNFTLPEQDGCKSLKEGQQCPLKKDEKYTYILDLPILQGYPQVSNRNTMSY
jgi:ML domain.